MPERKDSGIITKFVTVAIWSNFSAHKPAIIPIFPNIKDDKKVNKAKGKNSKAENKKDKAESKNTASKSLSGES